MKITFTMKKMLNNLNDLVYKLMKWDYERNLM